MEIDNGGGNRTPDEERIEATTRMEEIKKEAKGRRKKERKKERKKLDVGDGKGSDVSARYRFVDRTKR